jgi:hypothetical protein
MDLDLVEVEFTELVVIRSVITGVSVDKEDHSCIGIEVAV